MTKIWKPHEYQRQLLGHMLDVPRSAAFSGMGTGKTVCTLSAIDALQMTGEGPALVLAPLRVARTTWPAEARKWKHTQHMDVVPIIGSEKERLAALKRSAAVYTMNYENIPWLVEHYKNKWPFKIVVPDESTRLKSFRTRQGGERARALAKVAHNLTRRWMNLTGTPSPNGLKDLWGQTWFLDRGLRLGSSFSAFEQRWFRTGFDGYTLEPFPHAQAEIEERLRDICMTVTNGLQVDEPIFNEILVELPEKARKVYQDMAKTFFTMLRADTKIEAFNAAARSTKLLQIANGAVYDEEGQWHSVHDQKIKALESVIEEAAGAPVLVAYHFKHDLIRLRDAFPKARVLDQDPRTIDDWNAGKIQVLFAHPASAGHGLNLQDGGNILVFFSLNWNLEEHDQIIERIGPTRQKQAGYDRPVFIHYLLAADTLDLQVLLRLRYKRSVQDALLEALNAHRL